MITCQIFKFKRLMGTHADKHQFNKRLKIQRATENHLRLFEHIPPLIINLKYFLTMNLVCPIMRVIMHRECNHTNATHCTILTQINTYTLKWCPSLDKDITFLEMLMLS